MRNSRLTTEQIIGRIKQDEASVTVSELGRPDDFDPASLDASSAKSAAGRQQRTPSA